MIEVGCESNDAESPSGCVVTAAVNPGNQSSPEDAISLHIASTAVKAVSAYRYQYPHQHRLRLLSSLSRSSTTELVGRCVLLLTLAVADGAGSCNSLGSEVRSVVALGRAVDDCSISLARGGTAEGGVRYSLLWPVVFASLCLHSHSITGRAGLQANCL